MCLEHLVSSVLCALRSAVIALPPRPSLPIEATKNTNVSIYYQPHGRSIQSKSIPDVFTHTNERPSEINKQKQQIEDGKNICEIFRNKCDAMQSNFLFFRLSSLAIGRKYSDRVCVCAGSFLLNFIWCTVSVAIITWQYVKQKLTRKMTQTAVVVARCSARVHQLFIYRTLVARTLSQFVSRTTEKQRETDARHR